jgi:hypothetical protein
LKTIYYTREGRRYVPVREYDSDLLDSLPNGSHLIMCYPGGVSRRQSVDPNYAAMIAAGRIAEQAVCTAIAEVSKLRPSITPLTAGQLRAWQCLVKEFDGALVTLNGPSHFDIATAAVSAMQTEATALMKNPSVREAYEHFQLVCDLTRDTVPA